MTSNQAPAPDVSRARDAPLNRRTTSSTPSSSTNRYSIGSSEAGESSAAASKRNSDATLNDDTSAANVVGDGKRSHRSHRSRNSGGFLLSTFEPSISDSPPAANRISHQRVSSRDKGKAAAASHEKRHSTRRSNVGLGIGGSPLASNVTTAGSGNTGGDATNDAKAWTNPGGTGTSSELDIDSAQMVNLALNLSESRRLATRRNISTPLPSLASSFGEGFAGGSLRQHFQQQRRVSRNISPKPQRASTASPRAAISGQWNGPINTSHPEGAYQYQFSASTLARAEKAKTQIELMAQYRRLLQYVPPLKPERLERSTTAGSATPKSPSGLSGTLATPSQPLGRQYNPLQYVRNRKLRARERNSLNGEAQGFGDLEKVTSWIDEVSRGASEESRIPLPVFSKAAEIAASPLTSPKPTPGKSPNAQAKVKRPRIDWDINPVDMLADLFWLDQDDNKRVVEDHLGRKIFPQVTETKRPMSPTIIEPGIPPSLEISRPMSPDLRINTKLPQFKSMKSEEKHNSTTARVRHKISDATRIHHSHNSSVRESRQFPRARSRSDSSSSDTDAERHSSRRKRSGTAESHDQSTDILEKQMLEMLAKETRESEWTRPHAGLEPLRPQKHTSTSRQSLDDLSQSGSVVTSKGDNAKRKPLYPASSGRASLEVPGGAPRASLEEYDTTAPSSPLAKAARIANPFIPSIAMDLTPPNRKGSPSRMSKVRSKINPFEHTRNHSRARAATVASEIPVRGSRVGSGERSDESPETPEKRPRSMSPTKQVVSRKPDDSAKSSRRGSIRRGKTSDEPSGIRGLFKGNRGPVARVSDFLWKKESPVPGTSSGFSTDDSDVEEHIIPNGKRESRESSTGHLDDESVSLKPAYDLPTFISPTDRGRQGRELLDPQHERLAREERRRSSRAHLLEAPPRIDIHQPSPASSPDLPPTDLFRSDSSISDFGSRRASYTTGVQRADARLNDILGKPGHRGAAMWPVTGLTGIDTSSRRPSLNGKRQWSISAREVSMHRGPMTKREIARVRAILLSSGIKAKEISRRATELKDLVSLEDTPTVQAIYKGINELAQESVKPVSKAQQHMIAARILSDDIQLSKHMWQVSADAFCNTTVQQLVDRVEGLKDHIMETLTPMARKAADEADDVSKDLVTSQTLKVKSINDTMDKMLRRRRRKFRWLRRGGWVVVEWALVGVMWYVWLLVMFVRIFMGIGKALFAATRWLFWL